MSEQLQFFRHRRKNVQISSAGFEYQDLAGGCVAILRACNAPMFYIDTYFTLCLSCQDISPESVSRTSARERKVDVLRDPFGVDYLRLTMHASAQTFVRRTVS